jgi:anti-sigma regulatory factor (Ser/Thr protein kinase)
MFYLETRPDLVATAVYQPELTAAAAARRFVRDTLRSWDLTGHPHDSSAQDMWDLPSAPDVRDVPSAPDMRNVPSRPGVRDAPSGPDVRDVPSALGVQDGPSASDRPRAAGASGGRYGPGAADAWIMPSPRDEAGKPDAREVPSPRAAVAVRDAEEVPGSRDRAGARDAREMPGPRDAREMPGARSRAGSSGALEALVDDAVLLTSELVTNAVLHAGTPVQVTCRLLADASIGGVSRDLDGWAVEIAVLDRRPTLLRTDLPRSAAEAAERVNGRGLLLPAELASAWGVTYARAAKAVWFRMALPEPETGPAVESCPGPLAGQR